MSFGSQSNVLDRGGGSRGGRHTGGQRAEHQKDQPGKTEPGDRDQSRVRMRIRGGRIEEGQEEGEEGKDDDDGSGESDGGSSVTSDGRGSLRGGDQGRGRGGRDRGGREWVICISNQGYEQRGDKEVTPHTEGKLPYHYSHGPSKISFPHHLGVYPTPYPYPSGNDHLFYPDPPPPSPSYPSYPNPQQRPISFLPLPTYRMPLLGGRLGSTISLPNRQYFKMPQPEQRYNTEYQEHQLRTYSEQGKSAGPERGRRQNLNQRPAAEKGGEGKQKQQDHSTKKGQKPKMNEPERKEDTGNQGKARKTRQKQEDGDAAKPRTIPQLGPDEWIKIFNLLLRQFQGRTKLGTLMSQKGNLFKGLSHEDAAEWLKHSNRFLTFEKNGVVKYVSVSYKEARSCFKYKRHNTDKCANENCPWFHICRDFIAGCCPWDSSCHFNHSFHTKSNAKVCAEAGLQAFTDEEIRTIVFRSSPVVCMKFGKGGCQEDCPDIHICPQFLRDECNDEACKFGHLVKEPEHNTWVLTTYHMQGLPEHTLRRMVIVPKTEPSAVDAQAKQMPPDSAEKFKKPAPGMKKAQSKDRLLDISETRATKGRSMQKGQSQEGLLPNSEMSLPTTFQVQETNTCAPENKTRSRRGGKKHKRRKEKQQHDVDEEFTLSGSHVAPSAAGKDSGFLVQKTRVPKLSPDAWIKIFNFLLKVFQGRTELETLMSHKENLFGGFTYKHAVDYLKHSNRFLTFKKNGVVKYVSVSYKEARSCFKYKKHNTDKCANENCPWFHICRDFIAGCCPWDSSCHFNHSFHTKSNAEICKKLKLWDFTDEEIRTIVFRSSPVVCMKFGKGGCQEDCPDIHICPQFLRDECNDEACKFGHLVKGPEHNNWVLKTYHMQGLPEHTLRRMVIAPKSEPSAAEAQTSPVPPDSAEKFKKPAPGMKKGLLDKSETPIAIGRSQEASFPNSEMSLPTTFPVQETNTSAPENKTRSRRGGKKHKRRKEKQQHDVDEEFTLGDSRVDPPAAAKDTRFPVQTTRVPILSWRYQDENGRDREKSWNGKEQLVRSLSPQLTSQSPTKPSPRPRSLSPNRAATTEGETDIDNADSNNSLCSLCVSSSRESSEIDWDFHPENDDSQGQQYFQAKKHQPFSDILDDGINSRYVPYPIFSLQWEDSRVFSRIGGSFRQPGSDVLLLVPPDAVDEEVKIYSAICADVSHIRHVMQLLDTERVVTPLVEYWAGLDCKFINPVAISLPHCLPSDFDVNHVKVYHVSQDQGGHNAISRVKNLQENTERNEDVAPSDIHCETESEEGAKAENARDSGIDVVSFKEPVRWVKDWVKDSFFFVNEDGKIFVSATHFCAYVCTYCGDKQKKNPELFVTANGSSTPESTSSKPEIKILANIWDARIKIADFRKKFDIECEPLALDRFLLLNNLTYSSLHIRLRMFEETASSLQHRRDEYQQPVMPVEECFTLPKMLHCKSCLKKQRLSPIRKTWLLEPKDAFLTLNSLQFAMDVSHVTKGVRPSWRNSDEKDQEETVATLSFAVPVRETATQHNHGSVDRIVEAAKASIGTVPRQLPNRSSETDLKRAVDTDSNDTGCNRSASSNASNGIADTSSGQRFQRQGITAIRRNKQLASNHPQAEPPRNGVEHEMREENSGTASHSSNRRGDNNPGTLVEESVTSADLFGRPDSYHHRDSLTGVPTRDIVLRNSAGQRELPGQASGLWPVGLPTDGEASGVRPRVPQTNGSASSASEGPVNTDSVLGATAQGPQGGIPSEHDVSDQPHVATPEQPAFFVPAQPEEEGHVRVQPEDIRVQSSMVMPTASQTRIANGAEQRTSEADRRMSDISWPSSPLNLSQHSPSQLNVDVRDQYYSNSNGMCSSVAASNGSSPAPSSLHVQNLSEISSSSECPSLSPGLPRHCQLANLKPCDL